MHSAGRSRQPLSAAESLAAASTPEGAAHARTFSRNRVTKPSRLRSSASSSTACATSSRDRGARVSPMFSVTRRRVARRPVPGRANVPGWLQGVARRRLRPPTGRTTADYVTAQQFNDRGIHGPRFWSLLHLLAYPPPRSALPLRVAVRWVTADERSDGQSDSFRVRGRAPMPGAWSAGREIETAAADPEADSRLDGITRWSSRDVTVFGVHSEATPAAMVTGFREFLGTVPPSCGTCASAR